ncbi:MAG: DNA polymerase IV, partial [Pseudomonadota bacterium]
QPMFKALKACPDAVVIRPDMDKYAAVGRQIRGLMGELTPLVEPLSIDEAFLDLTGTERLHGQPAAKSLWALQQRIEQDIGVTVSVGLSHNKFLAKVASDLEKPRGFCLIGAAETKAFLAPQPIALIWGVGRAMQSKLARDGLHTIGQLQRLSPRDLANRYGELGLRLAHLAQGEDMRPVKTDRQRKSVSAETTFQEDLSSLDDLKAELWRLAEKLSQRTKTVGNAGSTVTLKLKTTDFKIRTRSLSLPRPIFLSDELYANGVKLLEPEVDGTAFRLLGLGLSSLGPLASAQPGDLFADTGGERASALDAAVDRIRDRYGIEAIGKGRGLRRGRP